MKYREQIGTHLLQLAGSRLMEKANTHMTHIEDLVILAGAEGIEQALDTFNSLFDELRGETPKSERRVSVKIDGCVSPETLLKTKQGLIPIIEIIEKYQNSEQVEIYSRDLLTEKDMFVPLIKAVSADGNKNWVTIVLEDGSEISCTEDHEVYTVNRGYVEARNLTLDDDIFESEG